MAADELDQLLWDRFDLGRADFIAALKTLPAQRPWAARLTADEARVLDDAGLREDPAAYAEAAADATSHMSRLYSTSRSAKAVAEGLRVNASRVRQRRLARTLWALDDGGSWVYPAVQFESIERPDGSVQLVHVRGLDRVLPNLLATGNHPSAVDGFLLTPQPELRADGRSCTPREWLLRGEPVEPVLDLVAIGEWTAS